MVKRKYFSRGFSNAEKCVYKGIKFDSQLERDRYIYLKSLEDKDFVFVHVEAPDEAGHNGDLRPKITAIENFDTSIVGVILNQLKGKEDFRILVLPDHYTPIKLRTHTADPIFFAMYGKGIKKNEISAFNEKSIKGSTFTFKSGSELMEYFIKQ